MVTEKQAEYDVIVVGAGERLQESHGILTS